MIALDLTKVLVHLNDGKGRQPMARYFLLSYG